MMGGQGKTKWGCSCSCRRTTSCLKGFIVIFEVDYILPSMRQHIYCYRTFSARWLGRTPLCSFFVHPLSCCFVRIDCFVVVSYSVEDRKLFVAVGFITRVIVLLFFSWTVKRRISRTVGSSVYQVTPRDGTSDALFCIFFPHILLCIIRG